MESCYTRGGLQWGLGNLSIFDVGCLYFDRYVTLVLFIVSMTARPSTAQASCLSNYKNRASPWFGQRYLYTRSTDMLDQRKRTNGHSFTPYGWAVCIWVMVVPFQVSAFEVLFFPTSPFIYQLQYGYHISVLNQIQAVLTCKNISPNTVHYGLPTCIPMSEFAFSVVTAIFTVGGLLGSLIANLVMDRWGRKGATQASALLVSLGAGIMGMSGSISLICFGR